MLEKARNQIKYLRDTYKGKRLPNDVYKESIKIFLENLNGFTPDGRDNIKPVCIGGEIIATEYRRIVTGSYGSYMEFTNDQLNCNLVIPKDQRWRANSEYIKSNNLDITHIIYEFNGVQVINQIKTIHHTDLRPGFFYVLVLDLDEVTNDFNNNEVSSFRQTI